MNEKINKFYKPLLEENVPNPKVNCIIISVAFRGTVNIPRPKRIVAEKVFVSRAI